MGIDYPEGHRISVIRGWDGTTFRNIKVSSTGELYILLSALYDSTILPLKCDALGNALMNIKAQDIAEIINRPKYGGAVVSEISLVINAGYAGSLVNVSGKGMLYGGTIHVDGNTSHSTDDVILRIDGSTVKWTAYDKLKKYGCTKPHTHLVWLNVYDDTIFRYSVGFMYGITFESSLVLSYINNGIDSIGVYGCLVYALV